MSDELPFLTLDVPPVGAVVKHVPEDFRVEEVPAYEPSGSGRHLFVTFQKRDLTTREAVRRIAKALGVDVRNAGIAGMKDRRAVTTQTVSFEGASADEASRLALEDIRVLRAVPHGQKLRTGHLRANRFVIRLRLRGGADTHAPALEHIREVIDQLRREGVPNFYGEQRFGFGGANVLEARRWIVGAGRAPRDRWRSKLLVSALQGDLFNRLLARRMVEGLYARVLDGDLCKVHASGGLFVAEDLAREQERADRLEISPTGPMFGAEMRWPERRAKELEAEVLLASGVTEERLHAVRNAGAGTRRALRVPLEDVDVDVGELEAEPGQIVLRFTLPKGAYATVVLRELLKGVTEDGPDAGDGDGAKDVETEGNG